MNQKNKQSVRGFADMRGTDYFAWIVLSAIVGLVPLLVRFAYVPVSPEEQSLVRHLSDETMFQDLFSYQKSVLFIGCVFLLGAFYAIRQIGEAVMPKWREWIRNPVFLAGAAYVLAVVLSSAFSPYGYVVTHGVSERYESIFVLLGYFVVLAAVYDFVRSRFQARLVLYSLSFSAAVIGLIGLFQYMKMDFFLTDFGHAILLPSSLAGQRYSQVFDRVYATLYNPNCVGLYTALMLPVTLGAAIFDDENKWSRIVLGVISALLFVCLIGSRSTGGLIGVAVDGVVFAAVLLSGIRTLDRKKAAIGTAAVVLLAAGILAVPAVRTDLGTMADKLLYMTGKRSDLYYKDIVFDGNKVGILSQYGMITVTYDGEGFAVADKNGDTLTPVNRETTDSGMVDHYEIEGFGSCGVESTQSIFAFFRGGDAFLFAVSEANEILPFYNRVGVTEADHEPAHIGFEGWEHWGSGRGYIWSRTFPLLGKNILLGKGPDAFVFEFPQNDMISKTRYLGSPYMVVDKPHNFYLQVAVNTGLLSLVALLVIFGFYTVRSFFSLVKAGKSGKGRNWLFGLRLGLLTGVCGYLAAALATDSVISVAPVFWAVLGLGFAVERIGEA